VKVQNLISYLQRNYSPEQEVMAFVVGSEYKEMSADLWDTAVEIWDNDNDVAVFRDYINDIIIDAEINLHSRNKAEEAVDSYLADLAEAELDEANV
jgi:hypothetical protein